jgi:hypothetical protein
MRTRFYLLGLLLSFSLIACSPKAKFLAPEYRPPEKIAILPTINQTIDVKGGIVFRNIMYLKLTQKKYAVLLENNIVDSLLNEKGITDGGQLKTMTNEELFNALNVDGIIYVDLLECEYKTLGVSETRKIKANFKLYSRPSHLIWEDEKKVDNGKSAASSIFGAILDPVGTMKESAKDLGKQVVMKAVKGWLLDHELKAEMEETLNKSLATLPKQ